MWMSIDRCHSDGKGGPHARSRWLTQRWCRRAGYNPARGTSPRWAGGRADVWRGGACGVGADGRGERALGCSPDEAICLAKALAFPEPLTGWKTPAHSLAGEERG